MRGIATLPQGNQELLVVKDKVGRPLSELGGKQVHGILQRFDADGWVTGKV